MNLKLVVLDPKNYSQNQEPYFYNAFQTYDQVWSDTFKELIHPEFKLYANDFSRQDYVLGLFQGTQCVALNFLREINLKNRVEWHDSWFSCWKHPLLENFCNKDLGTSLVNSYFTVHPDFRKSLTNEDYPISLVSGCLSVLYQRLLRCELMLGTMRNNRSMNKLGQKLGSTTIEENATHNNVPVDLVVFKLEDVKRASSEFPLFIHQLLNERLDFTKGYGNAKAA